MTKHVKNIISDLYLNFCVDSTTLFKSSQKWHLKSECGIFQHDILEMPPSDLLKGPSKTWHLKSEGGILYIPTRVVVQRAIKLYKTHLNHQ